MRMNFFNGLLTVATTVLLAAPAVAQTSSFRAGRTGAGLHRTRSGAVRVAAPGDELQRAGRQNWRTGTWRNTTRNRYTRYDAAHNNRERLVEDINGSGNWARRNRRTNA